MNKLLRNPIAVTVLAVVALGSVLWSFRGSFRRLARPVAQMAKPATNDRASAIEAALRAVPPTGPAPRPINRTYARTQMSQWLDQPGRDPFMLYPINTTPERWTNPPVELRIAAIWRQTGESFAVINGRVVREGEIAFDRTIERIESGLILLRGPNGAERLEFPGFGPAPALTNAAAGTLKRNSKIQPGG